MNSTLSRSILGIAAAGSQHAVAQELAEGLASPQTVLARVWLSADSVLRLAGSAGFPTGGGSYTRLDGTFSAIGVGDGKIGRIAATRTPLVVPSLRGDEEWLANPAWISRQGVRSFAGYPLASGDELLGVMAIFDRGRPSAEDVDQHELLARFAALRLIDLRQRDALRQRLAELDTRQVQQNNRPAPRAERSLSIITRSDLRSLERETLENALVRTGGRVFGARGAALLLGMKPTTLASRMKALGIPPSRAIQRRVKDHGSLGDRSQSDDA